MQKEQIIQEPLRAPNSTTWFETEQIETFVGELKENMSEYEIRACRKKLIVLHECGNNKAALIEQLKTMLLGLETNFDWCGS